MLQESEQGVTELPESVTSTKASEFWQSTPCSTPRSLSETSQPIDPSALLHTGLCKEPLTGQLSATGVEAPYQEHAPPLLPFNAYYRGNFASCRLFEGSAFSSDFPANARKEAQTSGEVARASAPKQIVKDVAEVEEAGENDAEDESSDGGSSSDEDCGLCLTYSADAPLPSVGSSAHSEGSCKRCCFFPKGRCSNGYDCQFCHFAHEKRKSKMKKKKKRRKKRQSVAESSTSLAANKNTSTKQAHLSASPSVQEVLGNSSCWAQATAKQPAQRPSQLIVQGLQYVPATVPTAVMPGNPVTMPMVQTVHWW
jgi:hypothetical protein